MIQIAVMKRDSILNIFLTVSVLSCLCHGRHVNVPESVTAVEGSCVTIPCSTSPHSHVVWYLSISGKDPIVYSRNTGDITEGLKGRTSVTGDPSQGDCSLRIDKVRSKDNSASLYPWIHPDTGNKYHYIKLNTVNPENPRISMESQQVEGKLFSATCSIRHSCPSSPPRVEWFGLSSVSNSVITTKDQGGLWTSVFQAKFKPTLQDHEKYLSCQSIFSSQRTYSESLKINVLYAPSDVRIQAEGNSVVEGGSLSLTCSATSRPPPSRYEWSVSQMNTTVKHSGTENRYTLKNIQRETSVSCTVFNSVGQGQSEQLKLNVHFPPKILLSPNCSEWAGGLLCVCRAEAEPRANVSWTVDGRRARFPHFNITTSYSGIVTASQLTGPLTGNVSCTASNYLSTDLHHTTVLIPQSGGNSIIIAAVAAVCVILGVTVAAVHLRKRRQIAQNSTSGQSAGSNTNLSKTADERQSNLYGDNEKDDDIYANTMEIEEIPTKKMSKRRKAPEPVYCIDDDIYANC